MAAPGKKSKRKHGKDKHCVVVEAKTVPQAMIRHRQTMLNVPAVICSDWGSQFVGSWLKTICKHMGSPHAKTVAYGQRAARRSGGGKCSRSSANCTSRSRKGIDFSLFGRFSQAFHYLPGPTELSLHRILFVRDRVSRTLPWVNHGKVGRDTDVMISEADSTVAKVCKCLHDEHERRAKYFREGKISTSSLKDTVLMERHHNDVLTRHRQQSWHIPGVIVRRIRPDVYAVQVGDTKILDLNHMQLRPRAPDAGG